MNGEHELGRISEDDSIANQVINRLREEWHSRTWYGKLWYPVWLMMGATTALAIGIIIFFFTGEPLITIWKWVVRRVYGRWLAIRPPTHREDSGRST